MSHFSKLQCRKAFQLIFCAQHEGASVDLESNVRFVPFVHVRITPETACAFLFATYMDVQP